MRQSKKKLKPPPKDYSRTLQMRLHGAYPGLDSMARRYGQAKRKVYAQSRRTGRSFESFKEELSGKFNLPSRVYNSIVTDLKGSVKSRQEKSALEVNDLTEKLDKIQKSEKKARDNLAKAIAENKSKRVCRKYHSTAVHKKESAKRLASRLKRADRDKVNPHPSICFGSRKRFNAQHHLKANGYNNHEEWYADWQAARSNQFLLIGSEDEASGNSTCRATVNPDGSVKLRVLIGKETKDGEKGETVILDNLRLPYGHDVWVAAIESGDEESKRSRAWGKETSREIAKLKAEGTLTSETEAEIRKRRKEERAKQPKIGAAIAYRFLKDDYGWRIFVTVTKPAPLIQVDFSRGAIGIDLNDGFISVTHVNEKGEFISSRDIPLNLRGLTTGQRQAAIHDVVTIVINEATALNVPIVIEYLNFSLKKRRLADVGCAVQARRLSSFAYSKFTAVLKSHARLHDVAVVEVNPAFTSVIGAALHAVPNGLSVHGAAAMVIARRAMEIEESLPSTMRIWHPHRAPLSIQRPDCLRRKATVEPAWTGWWELQKAVHAARDMAKYVRPTGKQRRASQRLELLRETAIPW
jgi:IS605 OrfB family transposase